jgi:hypothetical protein
VTITSWGGGIVMMFCEVNGVVTVGISIALYTTNRRLKSSEQSAHGDLVYRQKGSRSGIRMNTKASQLCSNPLTSHTPRFNLTRCLTQCLW